MLEHSLSAVPVAGSDGQIVGEITCDILFRYGLPDFFTRLKSVAFIREFDPFEKYFEKEADSVAGDVMSDHPAVMPPTATLLEIVFALAVEKHMNVYIVAENGALVGVIDRAAVLDRILNL
jgi:CBS-domain-containing membrane protein